MAKILIVDDEPIMRDMLTQMLLQDHHEVLMAENGEQGCAIYREEQPELIITDIVMPEKNGLEMLMDLKKEFPELRVIAISGGGGITGAFDYLPVAKLVGADQILKKPFGIKEIRDAIATTLTA